MSTINKAKPHNRRGAIVAMGSGLLLIVVELIALVIDQTTVHSIAHHVRALYAPYGLHPDPNWLFYYLYATAAIGILLWLTTIRLVIRQRRGARRDHRLRGRDRHRPPEPLRFRVRDADLPNGLGHPRSSALRRRARGRHLAVDAWSR